MRPMLRYSVLSELMYGLVYGLMLLPLAGAGQPAYAPPLAKALEKSAPHQMSSTDLASSPVTLVSSRSREDLTSPVAWPGTEFGSR